MTITNVNDADEFKNELKEKLTAFMEENKQFNVQGSWTTNGITVSVLVDFGIEDRDDGGYYVGSISARYDENRGQVLERLDADHADKQEFKEILSDSEAFREAHQAFYDAVNQVFQIPRHGFRAPPEVSDIDVSETHAIDYTNWPTRERVNFSRA